MKLFSMKLASLAFAGIVLCVPFHLRAQTGPVEKISNAIRDHGLDGTFILGGGLGYGSKSYLSGKINDIDSMFIFSTRSALLDFIGKHSFSEIERSLGLTLGSVVPFSKRELRYFVDNNIEILRVSGAIGGTRATIKLTDFETLTLREFPRFDRVLSKEKDRRMYERVDVWGRRVNALLINQTLNFEKKRSFVILDKNFYELEHGYTPGLIADFLMTARYVWGNLEAFLDLQNAYRRTYLELIYDFNNGKNISDFSPYFVRGARFSDPYGSTFNYQLSQIYQTLGSFRRAKREPLSYLNPTYFVEIDTRLFYGSAGARKFVYRYPDFPDNPATKKSLSRKQIDDLIESFARSSNTRVQKIEFFSPTQLQYSSNPNSGKIETTSGDYYFKGKRDADHLSIAREILNLQNVSQIFDHIVKPVFWDSDYLIFVAPWVNGRVEAQLLDDPAHAEHVLNIELRRAEENLMANLDSIVAVQNVDSQREQIHNLYFKRFVGERYRNYYEKKNFSLPGHGNISFEEFLKLTPVINGIEYEPLGQIIEDATTYLDPHYLNSRVKIYGLGDHHAGNVLVTGEDQYVTVDYEYAGVHHPSQDLAKTIYNDVYSQVLFSKTNNLKPRFQITSRIEGDKMIINHDYRLSDEKNALLEIKLKGILFPTLEYANYMGHNISNWEQILRASIVGSAMLNKNILEYDAPYRLLALALVIQLGSSPRLGALDEGNHFNYLLNQYRKKKNIQLFPGL